MSTNSLLASLYGGGSSSHSSTTTTTRSSSLFTKQYSFMTNNNMQIGGGDQQQRGRASSVSKMIENSSANELMKWTPLIKTVHKLTAKIKKNYFFFWCRMQAYIKSKNKLQSLDKENINEMSNTNTNTNANLNVVVDKIIGQRKQVNELKAMDKMPILCENITLLNKPNTEQVVNVMTNPVAIEDIPLPLPIMQQKKALATVSIHQEQQTQKPLAEKQTYRQAWTNPLSVQLDKTNQIDKVSETPKVPSQQQEIRAKRDNQLSNFVICLSKLNYRLSSKATLSCFLSLKRFSIKVTAVRRLCATQFQRSTRLRLSEVFRVLKRNSHQIMKSQILTNSLHTWIRKSKIQAVRFLYQKLRKEMKQRVIAECNRQDVIQEVTAENVLVSFQRFSFAKQKQAEVVVVVQDTPRFMIESDKAIEELHVEAVADFANITRDKQPQKPLTISSGLTIAKKATQFTFTSTSSFRQPPVIKDDTPLSTHNFSSKSNHQRMRRLSRLYPQQPFLQLPDISQITLFDSVIKNSSMLLFEKKRQQNKSMNTSVVSSINLCMDKERLGSLNSTITRSKRDFPISPRFDQQGSLEMNYPEEFFKKSASCASITVQNNSSSTNLKTNPNTPGSAKKIIGLFSKKNSVQLSSRDAAQNNFQSKLQTTKSAVLKKFDLFAELKTQQSKHKQKVLLSNSKENKNETNKKIQKERAHESKNATILNFSQQKLNQDSSKKLQQKNNSSKVVQKLYDMSAKRVGTGTKKQISSSKKENQSRYLNEKSSNRKMINRNESCKQNQLSQFNSLSKKVISYEEFMKNFPSQKISSTKNPLREVSENEPIFQGIHMTDQDLGSKDLNDCYGLFSAQLPKGKHENTQQKSKKLRSKIQKIEVHTARKMKMQIENMISQRKKSSIGILKF